MSRLFFIKNYFFVDKNFLQDYMLSLYLLFN